jgi:hypothetical protein
MSKQNERVCVRYVAGAGFPQFAWRPVEGSDMLGDWQGKRVGEHERAQFWRYRQRMQTRTLTPSALESSAADDDDEDEAAAEGAVRGRALGGGEASCSMGRSDQLECVCARAELQTGQNSNGSGTPL